jgi:hypothetical protein
VLFEVAIDFAELLDAHEGRFLAGVGALYFQELEYVRHVSVVALS